MNVVLVVVGHACLMWDKQKEDIQGAAVGKLSTSQWPTFFTSTAPGMGAHWIFLQTGDPQNEKRKLFNFHVQSLQGGLLHR